MNEYMIRYSDGTTASVEASSETAARTAGYRYNRAAAIVDVLPL
jgi:hypothetical protein